MDGPTVARFLHLLSAFLFVAALFATQWNGVAARRATDWPVRAALFEANLRISRMFALPGLIALGVIGNLLGMQLGYRMADTPTFRIVNGLWVLQVLLFLVVDLSAAGRLAALSRAAANAAGRSESNGGDPVDWKTQLGRWRAGNAVQSILFVVMLTFMARPWR